jgi:hypothetical protein
MKSMIADSKFIVGLSLHALAKQHIADRERKESNRGRNENQI